MFYGSNLYRKDKPRWPIGNAAETPEVPAARPGPLATAEWDQARATQATEGSGLADRVRFACGICAAWLIGLPRRAGARLYAMTDAEARWWYWHVTERRGGLVHQYRDARFEVPGYIGQAKTRPRSV